MQFGVINSPSFATLNPVSPGSNASTSALPVSLNATADPAVITETALTAAGTTTARSMSGYSKATYQVVLSNVGTNVIIAVEGSLDGNNWVNLNSADTTDSGTTLTVNKAYMFASPDIKVVYIRFNLRSIMGGTPQLAISLLRGN